MNYSLSTQANRSLSRGMKISLGLHLGALALLFLKEIVFPSTPFIIPPTLRVDLIGLPDLTKQELDKIGRSTPEKPIEKEPQSEVKEQTSKPDAKLDMPSKPVEPLAKNEMAVQPKQAKPKENDKRLKNALARIKALSRIENFSQHEPDEDLRPPLLLKGNRVSGGQSTQGDLSDSAENAYFETVRTHLQAHWELPVWLARKKLSAQAQVHIDPRGQLRSFTLIKSSGNRHFDEEVQRAIQSSVPFPAPPAGLATAVLTNGILVGFPL